jgi:hypothetical protein
MSATWNELLSRVNGPTRKDAFNRVQRFVNLNGIQSVKRNPSVNNAADVLSLWQVRHKNTEITGVTIPGAPVLIDNLMKMSPDAEVEQYGFTGEKLAGSIFFNRQTGEFLGDTIVERRAKNQQMLDLEAQLLSPSRKSA